MYGDFATVYDGFMADVPYGDWCAYLHGLIQTRRPGARRLLDLCCGTGSVSLGLAALGYDVMGGDLSQDMLQRAQVKARDRGQRVPFYRMDMTGFSLINGVDCITAMCDGINYLTHHARDDFFRCAYDALLPQGLLLFDFSTQYRLLTALGDNTFADENDDSAYILVTHREKEGCSMELTLFFKQGEYYRRGYEEHFLFVHDPTDLADALYDAGFSQVEAFSFLTVEDIKPQDERIMMIARR